MKKPLIAIAGGIVKDFRIEFAGEDFTSINNNYPKAIAYAGGIPIILPLINDIDILLHYILYEKKKYFKHL